MTIFLTILGFFLGAIAAYLLGSINFAIIITKLFAKEDIRNLGSGNAGMTNVLRTVGKGAAAITLLGDFLKGFVAVFLMRLILTLMPDVSQSVIGDYVAIYCALIGHVYPIFYGFKGGKGILVSFGALMVLSPIAGLICLTGFIITVIISHYVSLGSIMAAIIFPISLTLLNYVFIPKSIPWIEPLLAIPIAAFIIFMHRQNIKRLLSHTENKFSLKDRK